MQQREIKESKAQTGEVTEYVHLDFKEGRSKGWPFVEDLQKHQFGLLS